LTSRPGLKHPRPYAWLSILVMIMACVALLIGGIALSYVEQRMIASTGETLALTAATIADKLDRLLYERYTDALIFSDAAVFRTNDDEAKSRYLLQVQKLHPLYRWIGATDDHGRIVASTDPTRLGKDRSQSLWFRTVRDQGNVFVEDAKVSEDSQGSLAVTFAAPIKGFRGEFLGALETKVDLSVLEEVFANTMRTLQAQRGIAASKIEWQFMTRDGEVIVDSVLRQEGSVNLKTRGLPSALLTGSAQPGYIEEKHLRRPVRVVTGYAQTEQYGNVFGLHWGVLVRMERADIVAPIRALTTKLAMAGAAGFLPMLGVLFWTIRRVQREWAVAQAEATRATTAEARTRLVIDTALDAVIGMDADGRITEWNPPAEAIFGWPHDEAIGRLLSEMIVPPQHRDAHTQGLRRFLATGEGPVLNKRIEITACRRDGHEFPVELAISPVRSGDTVTFSAFVRDITGPKQTAAALRESERRYRNIVDHAGDIIYRADAEGRFTYCNPTAVRLLRYAETELIGRRYLDLLRSDHRVAAEQFYGRQFLRKTPNTYYEFPVLAKDGSELWIGQSVQIILKDGCADGFQAVARDITERKRAEMELQKANAELRQTLQEVKVLRGFIPICMSCKKIRDDGGYWQQIESYIQKHSEALFSHGICQDCMKKLYPEFSVEE